MRSFQEFFKKILFFYTVLSTKHFISYVRLSTVTKYIFKKDIKITSKMSDADKYVVNYSDSIQNLFRSKCNEIVSSRKEI